MKSDNSKNITMGNQQERLFNHLEIRKEEIIRLYLEEKKSLRTIAKILNCSYSGVKNILHKYNIPRRNKCESLNLCPDSFNEEEYQIILGSALGDGHITMYKENGESQLYIGHCVKQKDYLIWKYDKLKRFIGCNIYPLEHSLKYKGEIRKFITWNFLTRKSKLFTQFRKDFYIGTKGMYRKIIPIEILKKRLDVLGLSIWFMDDGTSSKYGFALETQSFSYEDNLKLLFLLEEKFDLCGKVRFVVNKKCILTFPSKSKKKLYDLISFYVVPCLKYKIE